MKMNRFVFLVGALFALSFNNVTAAEPDAKTAKKPVTDEYQGVKVEDDYQWLEKDDDPEVKAWSDGQNRRTRAYIDKLPDRAAIEKQLAEWYAKTSPSYSGLVSRPGILFALKFQPPKQQPMLVTLASADDLKSEKMVLDPNALDVPRRQVRGDLDFTRRQRRRDAAHLRNGHRQGTGGFDRACAISNGGRKRGLERGRDRDLLHAFSAQG